MLIFSFVSNQNSGVDNTSACNNFILGGVEPANLAFITKKDVVPSPGNSVAALVTSGHLLTLILACGTDIPSDLRFECGTEFRQVQPAVDTAELVIGFEHSRRRTSAAPSSRPASA